MNLNIKEIDFWKRKQKLLSKSHYTCHSFCINVKREQKNFINVVMFCSASDNDGLFSDVSCRSQKAFSFYIQPIYTYHKYMCAFMQKIKMLDEDGDKDQDIKNIYEIITAK